MYDYRDFAGYAYEKVSPTMSEVPFLVWLSPSYRKFRKDLVFDKNRVYLPADFIYSVSDLAGIIMLIMMTSKTYSHGPCSS